jgi:phosphate starvation-inducible protein PhoH
MMDEYKITLCSGLAGCGKTHIAVFKALEMLDSVDVLGRTISL